MAHGEIDRIQLLAIVMQCLDAVDHDLKRALEFAAAEILVLRTYASAGHRRSQTMTVDIEQVPALVWSPETISYEFETKGINE
jgi:hypothetical protein